MGIKANTGEGKALGGSTGDASTSRLAAVALEALAETRACSPDAVAAESGTSNGDVVMDSLEAVCVVAALEEDLGITLPGIEGLSAAKMTSIHSVVGLVSEFLSSSDRTAKSSTSIAN